MTDVLIKRELLERLAGNGPTSTLSATLELRAILDAQRQPAEADARVPKGKVLIDVAVVEFLNGSGELHGMHFGDHISGRPQFWWRHYLPAADAHPDDTLSAPRQPEGEGLIPDLGQFVDYVWNLKAERDTLRQQLAEANDDTSRWHEIACKQSKRADGLADQRDKLAKLLRDARHFCQRAPSLLPKIDAALAEANKP